MLIGASVIYIALAMSRVSAAIRANGAVLKSAGETIGDSEIPDVSSSNWSVGHWLTLGVAAIGIALVFWGVITYFGE